MATKEEIAKNKQFLLLSPYVQLYSMIVLSFKGSFQFVWVSFQSCLLQICCMWERVKRFNISSALLLTQFDEHGHLCVFYPINPFPLVDAFWRICCRWLLKDFMAKGNIASNCSIIKLPLMYIFQNVAGMFF